MKRVVGAVFALVAMATGASAQLPVGPEFRVNTATEGVQFVHSRSIATTSNGDFVVTWEHRPPAPAANEIRGQRFDVRGNRLGGEFRVNTSFVYLQSGYPAMDAAGNFIVTWAGGSFPNLDIFAQRFDAGGAPRGAEFLVNTTTALMQYRPAIAADDAGNFVVVWSSDVGDGSGRAVLGQRYDAAGVPLGSEFRVNTYTSYNQEEAAIASEPNGDFIVVWQSRQGSGYGIYGQRYLASGAPRGSEFRVNTYTNIGAQPDVGVDPSGGFVVAWNSADGNGSGIFAQRFDAAALPLGPEFQVNTYTTGNQIWASLDVAADGSFIVAWTSPFLAVASADVFAQRYDSAGNPRGGEFRVNSYTTAGQSYPGVSAGPDGRFVIVWSSSGQDGSLSGVYAQRFGGVEPLALSADTTIGPTSDGNGVLEPGETAIIAPAWMNANADAHVLAGTATAFTGPGAPGNPVYSIADGMASYGLVASGAVESCSGTNDCYGMGTTVPINRPSLHWDASFHEALFTAPPAISKTWTLHVGDSFADVARTSPFYRFIETLLHHGVTGGCSATQYCPATPTTRDQMAVFVLVAKEGAGYAPPACTTPVFADVPATSPFCRWIEELARRGVVSGCGGGNYCPSSPVTREQMAVFVLRTLDAALTPPPCSTPIYGDVPATSAFCRWIEELTRRNVVTGCGGGNYCPAASVTREQMGVFISATFGLTLYGP